jgi:outer membrane protein X
MKKLIILAVMLFSISLTAFAQNVGLGLNFGYGNEVSKPSIGAKLFYDINESFTVAPSFNYYFADKLKIFGVEAKRSCWDMNADVHWNFYNQNNYKLYPFAGLSYFNVQSSVEAGIGNFDVNTSESEGKFGFNLGFGGQMNLAENLVASAEVKYQIVSDFEQFAFSLSLIYKF